jgi:hypothetical protein
LVDDAIRVELARYRADDLVGISCLADGADQLFARAVLDAGGSLEVIVPATKYRDGLPPESHAEYDRLIERARSVERLDHLDSTQQAHMDASRVMLERADMLLAVWDGKPARGYGGTADVVQLARDMRKPVVVVWPEGASRE